MLVYFGRRYFVRTLGSAIKRVDCERCHTVYYYEIVRTGAGMGEAPYMLGQASAAQRAAAGAEASLRAALSTDTEPVACPTCSWVPKDVERNYRQTRFGWVPVVATALGFIAAVVAQSIAASRSSNDERITVILARIVIILGAAIAVGFIAQCVLRRALRLNRNDGERSRIPLWAPQAFSEKELVERRDAFEQQADEPLPASVHALRYDAPPAQPSQGSQHDWVVFRAGQLWLPTCCCECLNPNAQQYFPPFKLQLLAAPVDVYACAECRSRLRSAWWAIAVVAVVLSSGLAALTMLSNRFATEFDRMTVPIFLAALLSAATVLTVPALLGRPFGFRTVSAQRALYRLRFRNAQYTAMVRAASDAMERKRLATVLLRQFPEQSCAQLDETAGESTVALADQGIFVKQQRIDP
jgi:hypothetical protein